MKKIICAAAASMLLATTAFVGCGKDSDDDGGSGFTGKWACQSMEVDGKTVTEFNLIFLNVPCDAMLQMEIKEGGTCTIGTGLVAGDLFDADEITQTGTWEEVDDDTIKVHFDASSSDDEDEDEDDGPLDFEVDIDGDTFTVDGEKFDEEGILTFKRVSEFTTYDASASLSGLAEAFGGLSE